MIRRKQMDTRGWQGTRYGGGGCGELLKSRHPTEWRRELSAWGSISSIHNIRWQLYENYGRETCTELDQKASTVLKIPAIVMPRERSQPPSAYLPFSERLTKNIATTYKPFSPTLYTGEFSGSGLVLVGVGEVHNITNHETTGGRPSRSCGWREKGSAGREPRSVGPTSVRRKWMKNFFRTDFLWWHQKSPVKTKGFAS